MEDRLHALEVRLARAERRERISHWIAIGTAFAVVALAFGRPATIHTQERSFYAPFKVQDASGMNLMEVASDANGPYLRLFGKSGKPMLSLGADSEGGMIVLSNQDGHKTVSLSAYGGGGRMNLLNTTGKAEASLAAGAEGSRLSLSNPKGGSAHFDLADERGGARLELRDKADGLGVLCESLDRGGVLSISSEVPALKRLGAITNHADLKATPQGADLSVFHCAFDDAEPDAILRGGQDGGDLTLNSDRKPVAALHAATRGGRITLRDKSGKMLFNRP